MNASENNDWSFTLSNLYALGNHFADFLKKRRSPFLLFVPLRGAYPVYLAIMKNISMRVESGEIPKEKLNKMKIVFLPASISDYTMSGQMMRDLSTTLDKHKFTKNTDIVYFDTYGSGTAMIHSIPDLEKEICNRIGKKPMVNIFAAGIVDSRLEPPLVDFENNILSQLALPGKKNLGILLGKTVSVPICNMWEDTSLEQGVQVGTNSDDRGKIFKNLHSIISTYGGESPKEYFKQKLSMHGKFFPNKLKDAVGITFGHRETANRIMVGIERMHLAKLKK